MGRKIFISHKNEDFSNTAAALLRKSLEGEEHRVFLDIIDLREDGGVDWRDKLLTNLMDSDVVIVLLEAKTIESDWVQREVDTAIAANIAVIPVLLSGDVKTIEPVLERLDLKWLQFIRFNPADVSPILNLIEPRSLETVTNQKQWAEKLHERHRRKPIVTNRNSYKVFHHEQCVDVEFVIVTGDATVARGYEVLVNTENNYLQMARFYEKNTLSCVIRLKGAMKRGERIYEDTVQNHLFAQVLHDSNHYLPVPPYEVIATLAGHEVSDLRRHYDFRYILHAVAVQFNATNYSVLPLEDYNRIVGNCFDKILELDETKANVIRDGNGNTIQEANYSDISSVLFPVFGTGRGGSPMAKAVRGIIQGFREHFPICKDKGLKVNKIGLAVYDDNDLPIVKQAFIDEGFSE